MAAAIHAPATNVSVEQIMSAQRQRSENGSELRSKPKNRMSGSTAVSGARGKQLSGSGARNGGHRNRFECGMWIGYFAAPASLTCSAVGMCLQRSLSRLVTIKKITDRKVIN